MTAKVIIFDFDGTLANTIDVIVDITNRLALEFGYKQTTQVELEQRSTILSKCISAIIRTSNSNSTKA